MPEGQEELLYRMRRDPEGALNTLYAMYRDNFLGFAGGIGGSRNEHLESFHDAVLGFYEIFRQGKYDVSRASVKTLLFTIGKYKLLTKIGKRPDVKLIDEVEWVEEQVVESNMENNTRLLQVREAMRELGEQCQLIIELFYYNGLTIKEIVDRLGYKNENVVKAHKSRCMKKLRELCDVAENNQGK